MVVRNSCWSVDEDLDVVWCVSVCEVWVGVWFFVFCYLSLDLVVFGLFELRRAALLMKESMGFIGVQCAPKLRGARNVNGE